MSSESHPQWLDEQEPLEPEASAAQIASLQHVLGSLAESNDRRLKVLELGCGAGRIVTSLVNLPVDITAVDRYQETLAACRDALGDASSSVVLKELDFLTQPWPDGPFDAVICLGNTFMTIVELDRAVSFLQQASAAMATGGLLVLDDLPGDFWPDLVEGNWQSGVSDDGQAQMIWDQRDSVFAVRYGDAVDLGCWDFKPTDRRMRLWADSTLRLACRIAGLSEAAVQPGLFIMVAAADDGQA